MAGGPDPRSSSSSQHSSSTHAIAVATPQDAVHIQDIEKGESKDVAKDGSDDTRSLTESIRQHIVEGGLRYHAYHQGMYAFPNDDNEQYRDDLKHHLTIYLCHGRYFFAPVDERLEAGAEVLDLGALLDVFLFVWGAAGSARPRCPFQRHSEISNSRANRKFQGRERENGALRVG